MIRVFLLCIVVIGCKPTTETSLKSTEDSAALELVFQRRIHSDVQKFHQSLTSNVPITYRALRALSLLIDDSELSGIISFKNTNATLEKRNREIIPSTIYYDVYTGFKFGDSHLVFRKLEVLDTHRESEITKMNFFDVVPSTWRAGKSFDQRLREFINTKYYKKDSIKRLHSFINSAEFMIRMVPTVDGIDRAIRGKSGTDRILGVLQAGADIATFGIGSKVKAIQNGTRAIVLTAASARVSRAAYIASQGEANIGTAADAALAVLESALVGLTFVKVKIPKGTQQVIINSDEEASIIARALGRNADDIRRAGVSVEDLKKLGVDVTKLARFAKGGNSGLIDGITVDLLEDALKKGNFDDPKIKQLFENVAKSRGGRIVEAGEKPVVVLYEMMIRNRMKTSGKTYAQAIDELTNFNLLYAGNNTAKSLRIPKTGSAKPVAIHRVIGDVLSSVKNGIFPKSREAVKDLLKSLGYTDLDKHDYIIEKVAYFFSDAMPSASTQNLKLFSVQDTTEKVVKSASDSVSSYMSRGVISTATEADAALSFLRSDTKKAILYEFLPSPGKGKVMPITGSGELADAANALQKARNYDGAVPNEVIFIPGQNSAAKIVGTPTKKLINGVEVTIIKVKN